jgi:nanoRNase/pAp phosphatase (c-di-AMP/oligoRNAs hydrolase)
MHVLWGLQRQNTVFAIGKSITNRTSKINIGEACLKYDGGGHANAGTCQIANEQAENVCRRLIEQLSGELVGASK